MWSLLMKNVLDIKIKWNKEKNGCFYVKFLKDLYIQKSSNMLDDVLRFERTILSQEEQI